ncbi:hypothetical protein FDC62_11355 [Clostridium botulinum]|uniref:hypothetical protein n=1 Tax=Clostridium botulinum TaxID=1491 RepID=UPI000992C057|nr:hypothetical protein [Clostridium botulinum]NFO98779.1 hypothetical protein [Clostridium botulinum]OOV52305.1 hypothetical protein B1A66_04655 [Clostridium botulinum D/C]OOV54073.1 hypothetical protein B0673_11460 [Clostridium botulinum D/C]OOV58073.1 hypothetical protein B1A67_03495 [Clostridium botulinum D/C]
MLLYHGTNKNSKDKIQAEGFIPHQGEYGNCIYFAQSKDFAYDYGDEIIEVWIDSSHIKFIDVEFIDNNYIDVESFASENEYKAVGITYSSCKSVVNQTEICVFDSSIIEDINFNNI